MAVRSFFSFYFFSYYFGKVVSGNNYVIINTWDYIQTQTYNMKHECILCQRVGRLICLRNRNCPTTKIFVLHRLMFRYANVYVVDTMRDPMFQQQWPSLWTKCTLAITELLFVNTTWMFFFLFWELIGDFSIIVSVVV